MPSTPCKPVCVALIENRTRMLAAISHDLRTPLTLLRLRAENVENAAERDKMLATIAEMDSMVATTLQFARDEARRSHDGPRILTALRPKRCRRHGRCRFARDDGARRSRRAQMPTGCSEARAHQSDRQCGEIWKESRARDQATPRRLRRSMTKVPGIPETGTLARLRTVLSCRRISKPRNWRGRSRPRHSAVDCAVPRRRLDPYQQA